MDLPLYGVLQGWNAQAAAELVQEYREAGFEGITIAGLVPRLSQPDTVDAVIQASRTGAGTLPVHAFGIGHPDHVARVSKLGVDSVDSSSYVKYAAAGRLYTAPQVRHANLTPHARVHLAPCNLAALTGSSMPLSAARFTRTLER